jgi:hypothetical protein
VYECIDMVILNWRFFLFLCWLECTANSLQLYIHTHNDSDWVEHFFHHGAVKIVVSPPGCGRNVTDFCGWDAHEAQLRCPDEVDGDI